MKIQAIIQVVGFPQKYVEETIKLVKKKLNEDKNITTTRCDIAQPEETQKGVWSAFLDIDGTTKDIISLFNFCADYLPTSIEIIEPGEITMQRDEMSKSIDTFIQALHKYHATISQINAQNAMLQKKLTDASAKH